MSAIAYRESQDSDARFIRGQFLDSYRCAHAAGMILMEDWEAIMGPQFDKILAYPGVKSYVAYKPSEDDKRFDLYGFIVVDTAYEPAAFVVYCAVKHKYRRLGVATGLFAAAGIKPSEEFHYAAKTGVTSKVKTQIPLAKWKPLAIRFAPKDIK